MMKQLINTLANCRSLTKTEYLTLIQGRTPELVQYAAETARSIAQHRFGNRIYIRGLIEFTNFCKNDCYYCGLRKSNRSCNRYRLTPDEILDCCAAGYELGFRTFVLQGGEDPVFSDDQLCVLVTDIKKQYPDCAVTLSVGERTRTVYERYRAAGADRYLLRHETANAGHYGKLHPPEMNLETRKRCLRDLKDLGFQVGTGCLVGSPFQTAENLCEDLMLMQDFRPQMIGIGPFIPHQDTPFGKEPAGSLELTLFLVSLLRIAHPDALIPATTAVGTLREGGREQAILSGANVVMPNLSPPARRKDYSLYDNKLSDGAEAAEALEELTRRLKAIGYMPIVDRGDFMNR